jgi:hypothetical protein
MSSSHDAQHQPLDSKKRSRSPLKRFLSLAYYERRLRRGRAALGLPNSDDRTLSELKGRYVGRTGFIIGNGPSLRAEDLDALVGFTSLASNKIYLIFPETAWRPDYYFVEDPVVWQTASAERGRLTGVPCFAPEGFSAGKANGLCRFRRHSNTDPRTPGGFGDDPRRGFFAGGTVCFSMLQMAAYMGFRRIVLIGVDHHYSARSVSTHGPETERATKKQGADHFSPDYYLEGDLWIPPDVQMQTRAFALACAVLRERGVELVNATRTTQLDVVPRRDLEEVLEEERIRCS